MDGEVTTVDSLSTKEEANLTLVIFVVVAVRVVTFAFGGIEVIGYTNQVIGKREVDDAFRLLEFAEYPHESAVHCELVHQAEVVDCDEEVSVGDPDELGGSVHELEGREEQSDEQKVVSHSGALPCLLLQSHLVFFRNDVPTFLVPGVREDLVPEVRHDD